MVALLLFEHLNFQKCSDNGQRPKLLRERCVFTLLTWKCALHHNAVHFINISTSKSAPNMVCLVLLNFEMCFAPPGRDFFFYISNSQSAPSMRCYDILSSKCASRLNGMQFVIVHLSTWLRTRRFSEPTFRPSRATKHWTKTVFRDSSPFHAPASSFLCLSLLWSSFFCLSLLWLFPLPLFHLPILSEVWLLPSIVYIDIIYTYTVNKEYPVTCHQRTLRLTALVACAFGASLYGALRLAGGRSRCHSLKSGVGNNQAKLPSLSRPSKERFGR